MLFDPQRTNIRLSAKWLTSALENIVMQSSHNVERTLLSLYLYQKTI